MSGLLNLVQRGGDWAGPQPALSPLRCTKCITAHPSTANVSVTVLLYNGRLLCGFNVPINGQLTIHRRRRGGVHTLRELERKRK